MFLRTAPNPHDQGRPARVVRFQQEEDRVFAIDADELHRNPKLLNTFSRHHEFTARALDAVAYAILIASVIAAFAIASVWVVDAQWIGRCPRMTTAAAEFRPASASSCAKA